MPINWDRTPDGSAVGVEMLDLMRELYPLPRSLTGAGVRATLDSLGRELPIEIIEIPSGKQVFDWTVPREWAVREAWIEGPDGERLADFSHSPLHLLGYSTPIDTTLGLAELRRHVFTHPHDPDLIPYRTSYWEEQWGFCMSSAQLEALSDGEYHVVVDSTLEDGSLTMGEQRVAGSSDREFLLSTYLCHPALANDNLSGIALLWALGRTLAEQNLTYTYRLLWSPGTLGPLCWLDRNLRQLSRIEHGLAISCVGDPGPLRYKRSRRGDATIDRAAIMTLRAKQGAIVRDWDPSGGDERQFCAPGFDLPLGTISRSPHGTFPEYHSSADNLDIVTAAALADSLQTVLEIIDTIDTNGSYINLSPFGEPQLGRRGLYPSVPDGTNTEAPLLWTLSLSDENTDLLAVAERSGLPYSSIRDAAEKLEQKGLLKRVHDSGNP